MTEPPFSAAQEAARTAAVRQCDIINLRCTHRMHEGVTTAYRMSGRCRNCGTTGLVGLFTKGHEASGGSCPACGCSPLTWDRLADLDPETAL